MVILATTPLLSPCDQLLNTTMTIPQLHNVKQHATMTSMQISVVRHYYATSNTNFTYRSLTPTSRKLLMLAPCPVALLKLTPTLRTYALEAEVVLVKTYSRPTQILRSSSSRFGFKKLGHFTQLSTVGEQ
jgi:hypothetical protein